ncbi:(4Fe-4S)-binding protein [Actinoplanes sp. NPDC051470]|uniref:ferredoxin n=1 Tax=unclassified Actinoplanes TaxID=2626549 RepID=UPI00342EA398
MRIKADTGVCVGAGQCVLTDPDVFDQDDDGIVALLTDRPEGEAERRARDAVMLCPSQALSIIEE